MNIKIKYKKVKRCLDTFRELPLTRVLPSRDSNAHQYTNQTGTVREQKLRGEAAVIGELKGKYECYLREHCGKESLNVTNMNLLIRFDKAREIFSSVTRVLSIF